MMQHEQWYIDGCTKASEDEWALYREWTGHLPVREESTPYHSGPHSIKNFRHALSISGWLGRKQSFGVVEVGFCLGHSSSVFLELGVGHVYSIESSAREQTMKAKQIMEDKWRGAFTFLRPEGVRAINTQVDFGFIDGDHSEEAISRDIDLMISLNIPWILFDDWYPKWGDTQEAMRKKNMAPVAILGTMALWGK